MKRAEMNVFGHGDESCDLRLFARGDGGNYRELALAGFKPGDRVVVVDAEGLARVEADLAEARRLLAEAREQSAAKSQHIQRLTAQSAADAGKIGELVCERDEARAEVARLRALLGEAADLRTWACYAGDVLTDEAATMQTRAEAAQRLRSLTGALGLLAVVREAARASQGQGQEGQS